MIVGKIVIERIVESICTEFDPLSFFPGTTPDDWARHRGWMLQRPQALEPVSGNLVLSIQAFLVRTRQHDTHRYLRRGPQTPAIAPVLEPARLNTFLPRLAAAGVSPSVDYVMCTHLHGDHVGWNAAARRPLGADIRQRATSSAARNGSPCRRCTARSRNRTSSTAFCPSSRQVRRNLSVTTSRSTTRYGWSLPGAHAGPCQHPSGFAGCRSGHYRRLHHSPVQCLEPAWIMRADSGPELAKTTRLISGTLQRQQGAEYARATSRSRRSAAWSGAARPSRSVTTAGLPITI